MYGFHLPGNNLYKVSQTMNYYDTIVGQIFIRSPRIKNGPITTYGDKQIKDFKRVIYKNSYRIFTHATYGVSLVYDKIDKASISSLVKEIEFIDSVGGEGTVVHVGSSSRYGYEVTLDKICKNVTKHLINLHSLTKNKRYRLFLENQATAGKKVMTTVDEMITMCKYLRHNKLLEKVGFCFDTCHDYVSSYIEATKLNKTRVKVNDNLKRLIKVVGHKNVGIVHLNDNAVNTKDVHADLLNGNIPPEELMDVILTCKKYNIPMLIERYKSTHEDKLLMLMVVKSILSGKMIN
jgi:endonuclease IV